MPQVELVGPNRLNIGGVVYHKGKPVSTDFETAFSLKSNPRFKVTGLDTREALEHRELAGKPGGTALLEAIRDAADELDIDDEENFDRSGKPSVAALTKALGYPVTKEERDRALNAVEKAPQAAGEPLNTAEIKATQRKFRVKAPAAAAPVAEPAPEQGVTV